MVVQVLAIAAFGKSAAKPCTDPVTQCVRELRRLVGRPRRTSGRFRRARRVISRAQVDQELADNEGVACRFEQRHADVAVGLPGHVREPGDAVQRKLLSGFVAENHPQRDRCARLGDKTRDVGDIRDLMEEDRLPIG